MKQKETIRSLWMPTARLLCGFRRVAMLLLATLLLTMTALTAQAETVNVSYLDASGASQSVDATPVAGRSLGADNSVTWYVVNSDVELTSGLSIYGTVHLILADNKTLSVNANDYAIYMNDNSSLTIYSQSLGQNMGKLVINYNYSIYIGANSLTINGGDILVTTYYNNYNAVYLAAGGSMTINNGTVSLDGSVYGVNNENGFLTINGGTVTITAQTPIMNTNNYTKTGGTVRLNSTSGGGTVNVIYLDASGNSQSHAATPVTDRSLGADNSETWYVVNSDVELTSGLGIYGTVHLILADNKTLSVNANDYAIYMNDNSSLTIYSQSLDSDMGKLVINSNYPISIDANSLTINGGDISVTNNDNAVYLAAGGSMTINNGTVSLTGKDYGVSNGYGSLTITGGTVTITAQSPIYNVNNYTKTGGTVTLKDKSGNAYYKVLFDANGGSDVSAALVVSGGTVSKPEDPTRDGYVFVGWYNGANEYDFTAAVTTDLTLTAKWGKNIANCTATVPNQTMERFGGGYDYPYIYFKFEDARNNPTSNVIDETVTDGNTTLTLGTDYTFGSVSYANGNSGDPCNIGDECLVEIKGMGNYGGSLYASFTIVSPSGNGTWGGLTWSLSDGTLTISGDGPMVTPQGNGSYPWLTYKSHINTITIGDGVTSVADGAFATEFNDYHYTVSTVNLPTTSLTTIGANAFAYCEGANITIPASVTSVGETAFYNVAKVTATLSDANDNTTFIARLFEAKTADISYTRSFTKDANSTVCLPFSLSSEQASAAGKFYEFVGVDKSNPEDWVVTMQDANLTANNPLTANKPYLFKPAATGNLNFTGTTDRTAVTPVDQTADTSIYPNAAGWTFKGTYARINWTDDPQTVYGFAAPGHGTMSEGKFFRVKGGTNSYITPFRAYLQYVDPSSARGVTRGAGETLPETMTIRFISAAGATTAIGTLNTRTGEISYDGWYTLDGHRLAGKPSTKGMYINNGKKVVIK